MRHNRTRDVCNQFLGQKVIQSHDCTAVSGSEELHGNPERKAVTEQCSSE